MSKMAWGGAKYSETEQIVGTWIDGKPIYQKSYHLSRTAATSTFIIDSNLNADTIIPIGITGFIKLNTGKYLAIGYGQGCNFIVSFSNEDGFTVNTSGGNYSFSDVYVTIQYTKTTD